jgi:hypothetical protein
MGSQSSIQWRFTTRKSICVMGLHECSFESIAYPNAVNPKESGEFQYDTLFAIQEATLNARKGKKGIWPHIDLTLLLWSYDS